MLKIAIAVRKEREMKAKEIQDLVNDKNEVANLLKIHQEKLQAMEKELRERGASSVSAHEDLDVWKKKSEDAETRAENAERNAEQKVNELKSKVKQLLMQQEAKYKQQLSSAR